MVDMSVYDEIAKVLAHYPDAGVGDAEVLTDEVEEQVLANADTVEDMLRFIRPLLRNAVMSQLRGRTRKSERKATKGRRQRRNRRQIRVQGQDGVYVEHTIEELRQLLLTPGIEALLDKEFIPSRGNKPVTYGKATEAQHMARVQTQETLAESILKDADLHRLFAEAIRTTDGAKCYDDVKKAWQT